MKSRFCLGVCVAAAIPAALLPSLPAQADQPAGAPSALELRRAGRNAEAAGAYEACLRAPGADPARLDGCRRGLAEVDALVGRLTIRFDDPRARVWLDGRELPGFTSGATIRVDPGDHLVAAGLAGAPPTQGPIRVGALESREIELRLGASAAPPAVMAVPMLVPVAPPPAPVVVDRPVDGRKVAGIVLIAVGGVGVMGGVAASCVALVMGHDAGKHCLGGGDACEPRGIELTRQAMIAANTSTVTLTVGGVMIIVGSILEGVARGSRRGSLPGGLHVGAGGLGARW